MAVMVQQGGFCGARGGVWPFEFSGENRVSVVRKPAAKKFSNLRAKISVRY
jgi:hypothetical protein